MKIKKINNQKVQYFFKVSSKELETQLSSAYEKIKSKVEIKGFRKGHVPRKIFENHFGKNNLYSDALENIVQTKYQEILQKKDFESMGMPQVIDLNEKKLKDNQNFTFGLEFIVKPKVILKKYLGLEITKDELEVKDCEVEEKINSLLEKQATLESKTQNNSLELTDTAVFDFEGFVDEKPFEGGTAKNFSLKIGSGQFLPGFEDQMLGMKQGQNKDINITFPSDYHQKKLANKKVIFKVTLHQIKTKKIPQLTDNLVKLLKLANVSTVEELKNNTKKTLLDQKKHKEKENIKKQVIEQLVKNSELQIPQEIISQEKTHLQKEFEKQLKQQNLTLEQYKQYLGIGDEKMEKEFNQQAQKNLQYRLIIEQVAFQEKLTISKEKIEQQYKNLSNHYKVPVNQIKQNLPEKNLQHSLLMDEALDLVINKAVVVTK
ncbi:trigger factor, PPIase [Aster yellows witches'-broom phytoplasma AYWB]|uniref:Trigger factor n=1 Tax=Aster yellows witches'-broom phytoplasma (strain AYWB) TaxID=322098 RepID=TIG_AYWBP|nr:trigger factor [Aster yellows witches'-broom phytoplasma]Q2NJE2.1 RecName: Full=Trigger factor; Short=TF; AltName: Full=PPIase [Aster yellows witches'-broom phytoplasma AYWB]ABC65451.1 trigger factor, PPIase [Aster yellows witches'-broom phytoplasma AYWB]